MPCNSQLKERAFPVHVSTILTLLHLSSPPPGHKYFDCVTTPPLPQGKSPSHGIGTRQIELATSL